VARIADEAAEPTPSVSARLGGARSLIVVPMLKENELIGAISIYRLEVRPFTDKQIELVQNFAAQAVIAIENTRLLNELRESLERQTATSEVLGVISRSKFELQPILQSVVDTAERLCHAEQTVIYRLQDGVYRFAAGHSAIAAYLELERNTVISPGPGTVIGRAAMTRQIARIEDAWNDPLYEKKEDAKVGGVRSMIGVPLMRDGEPIGVIGLARCRVEPFSDREIELVKTFADQAVIAIENVRLFEAEQQRARELTEALEQQTATSEVLHVISSSPGELQPVFDAILNNATRICQANFGTLFLREGEALRVAAHHGSLTKAWDKQWGVGTLIQADASLQAFQTLLARQPLQVVDLSKASSYLARNPKAVNSVEVGGIRTMVTVPMLKDTEAIGVITIFRTEVREFTDKQIALVTSFAAQAVIAIENARLLGELRQRTDELSRSVGELRALGEVSRAVNSTLDLQTVLATIVAKAVQLSGTEAGAIYAYDETQREFHLSATYGMDPELIDALTHQHIGLDAPIFTSVALRGEPVQTADLRQEAASEFGDIILRAGYRARLMAPLVRGEQIVGILVVRRKAPGEFPQNTIDLMKTFAAQSVLAIQNARLFHEIEDKGRQLEVASRHKSQFLANMSHELRTPLNAILGYTELILDSIYGEAPEKMRGVLERVQANGKHLLGLINDVLDLSKIEAGQLTLSLSDYSLTNLVQGVYIAVEPLASKKNLALTTKIAPSLPAGHGDERRLAQVLLNLVGNAIKFTDKGEVAIEASLSNGSFRVAVRDSGPGIAAADQAKIFEEFQQVDNTSTREKGGTGLGLAISKRIVEMHGGRISVESQIGKGSTFTIKLPVNAGGEGQVA
jgi:signal transduction histidine kinase/putative methionine-R-sulfoxide reductase with GAF domain